MTDRNGWLMPSGVTLAWNWGSTPEPVMTPAQHQALLDAIAKRDNTEDNR